MRIMVKYSSRTKLNMQKITEILICIKLVEKDSLNVLSHVCVENDVANNLVWLFIPKDTKVRLIDFRMVLVNGKHNLFIVHASQ